MKNEANPQIEVNSDVEHDKGLGVVQAISRGWFTVLLDSGETIKSRVGDLTLCESDEDEESIAGQMTQTLKHYREVYEKSVSASGAASLDNGDRVAKALRGEHHLTALVLANMVVTPFDPEFDAHSRYGHLNVGSQRMNAGNKIRGAIRREEVTSDEVMELLPDAREVAQVLIAAA